MGVIEGRGIQLKAPCHGNNRRNCNGDLPGLEGGHSLYDADSRGTIEKLRCSGGFRVLRPTRFYYRT